MGFGVAIYVFTKDLDQAVQIMERHLRYPRAEWIFVGKLLRKYIRGSNRDIYFCGTGYDRSDFLEARALARKQGWNIKDKMPERWPDAA